ncbi:MAG: DUF3793 family protein [Muribaculaceae bacterium]|nr:DUF3793 family protein [Roseburia sp.]MCM1431949.1 DUF3793 family protein [Muribaculaceae bacterium]MCM1493579.1 DUF3793 family protein [Muribaculaceae bacterium]
MSEDIIIRHCSPTLAGLKTGNLFSCPFTDEEEMRGSVRHWNRMLVGKGLRVLPLKFGDNRALVYVYRVSSLSRDLKDNAVCRLLKERGYETEVPERCIVQLIRKLEGCREFPHEIGLFLGYPPEDVCGFIENKAKACKLAGCWKVYGNEEKARITFAKYKKCTDVYTAQFARDRSIDRLTVAG